MARSCAPPHGSLYPPTICKSQAIIAVILFAAGLSVASAGDALPGKSGQSRTSAACTAYGEGFAAIEGTDTCVKIGGRVRLDYGLTTSGFSFAPAEAGAAAPAGLFALGPDRSDIRAQGAIAIDSRTTTDGGPLRTYVHVRGRSR